jgi:predicted GNAT family acetyltransferase
VRNDEVSRYEGEVDGQPVGHVEFVINGTTVTITHTTTQPHWRGRGVAAQLVQFALADIRAHGRTVRPQCSYVAHYIEQHPEYADLVA